MFYKVTLGFTTGATYNMTNVHVFKAAQARRAYFLNSSMFRLWIGIGFDDDIPHLIGLHHHFEPGESVLFCVVHRRVSGTQRIFVGNSAHGSECRLWTISSSISSSHGDGSRIFPLGRGREGDWSPVIWREAPHKTIASGLVKIS